MQLQTYVSTSNLQRKLVHLLSGFLDGSTLIKLLGNHES